MPKIAIDVVLLPPEAVMDKAIEINSKLADDTIKLNKRNCLPHISLCMGVIEEENLLKIKRIIDGIAAKFPKLCLTINKINCDGACFEIKDNEDLRKLHETIMNKLMPYLSYNATTNRCFSPPAVADKTLFWINNYKEKSSFGNFYPHITLGISNIKNKELNNKETNIKFIASKLAVCHLGNYCTCRKIFHSVNLNSKTS